MTQRAEKRIKSDNLDLEFRKILCVIREHIPQINSNTYLMQCRVWLEKLSCPNVNKILRNLYLIELSGQIQKNKLLTPFNEAPPSGSLKSLTKALIHRKAGRFLLQGLHHRKSRPSNLHNSIIHIKENDTVNKSCLLLCPKNTETWDFSDNLKSDKKLDDSPETSEKIHDEHIPIRIGRREKSAEKLTYQGAQVPLLHDSLDCGEPMTYIQKENEIKNHVNSRESTQNGRDEDSWSDLTDGDSSADASREENKLQAEINRSTDSSCQNSDEAIHYNVQNKIRMNRTDACNDSKCVPILKGYDVEGLNIRIPKDTNYISTDWKNTIDALQLRLSEMAHQNNELKSVIQKMEIEMDDVRNRNMESIFQLEKSFQASIDKHENDCEEKTNKLISSYEQKITEINKQNEVVTRIRDNEIYRLTDVIQQQCARITNDISALQTQVSGCSCDKKLLLLKKCVSKMDKLFQRSEKEYLKQIDRLRQELEIKNTALQIQLKIQKAELMAETSSDRHEEFDKILNSLEIKYIKMLEMHENQIMEIKKQDDEKIQSLKELLSKHGIAYDEDII